MTLRNRSFVWGGCTAAVLFIIGLLVGKVGVFAVLAVLGFTLASCLVLDNNFLGDMIVEIFSWGFVRMPGVIFELDLDGILWLLTVKLIFWILGLILAVLAGALAIALGLALSLVVYPFALYKNIHSGENA